MSYYKSGDILPITPKEFEKLKRRVEKLGLTICSDPTIQYYEDGELIRSSWIEPEIAEFEGQAVVALTKTKSIYLITT